MVKFKDAPHPALSYAAVTAGPGPLVDPALVVELEKLERINSSLRAENKFLWGLLGTVIFVFSLTTWGSGGVLRGGEDDDTGTGRAPGAAGHGGGLPEE